jgi:predicted HTH transcriptional regulator
VEELTDKSFRTVDLPDPERLIKEFWDIVNNPNKTSVNVLFSKDVFVQEVGGNHIVVINVPRAERSYKPVYVDGNPLNTYRRNGEGDYRCTKEEYQAMVRDASVKTQDMLILDEMDVTVFNKESIRSYRQRMRLSRPGHVWEALEDEDFLLKLGAVGIGSDGKKHPTSAGLLMFGNEYDIVREFNAYFLDYQEQYDIDTRWTDRIISSSGDWSGNVYDFYFRVYNKLIQDIKVPFKMEGGARVDDTSVHQALREALANCLVNADYYGRQGLVIVKKRNAITMSNPGGFRIEIDAAKSGGLSDPRNGTMLKMFNLIDIGERAGSGIPNIFRVWREQGWVVPTFTEQLEPERTILALNFEKTADKKPPIKNRR